MKSADQFRKRFYARIDPSNPLLELFEHLPDVYFFLKTADSEFVRVNRAMYRKLLLDSDEPMIGKTDRDFYPRELAERYIAEDQRVMRSRKPLLNQVWLVPTAEGQLRWYISSKMPVFDRKGKVIGIVGAMRDYERAGAVLEPYQEMNGVIQYVDEHYADRITTDDLAHVVHLSVSQFERRFKKLFQMTPMMYVERVRINVACEKLVKTHEPIAAIAQACGYFDQSYFTRRFRRVMRTTPSRYRRKYSRER